MKERKEIIGELNQQRRNLLALSDLFDSNYYTDQQYAMAVIDCCDKLKSIAGGLHDNAQLTKLETPELS